MALSKVMTGARSNTQPKQRLDADLWWPVTTKTLASADAQCLAYINSGPPSHRAKPLLDAVEPRSSIADVYDISVCTLPTWVELSAQRKLPDPTEERLMVLLLALLLVLIFFGLGFAVHLLWIAAVVLLVLWVIGFAVGRGESAGTHRFYRW